MWARSARSPEANEVAWFSAALRFEGLDHPVITRVANPILSTYWRGVSRLLPTVRAARRARRSL